MIILKPGRACPWHGVAASCMYCRGTVLLVDTDVPNGTGTNDLGGRGEKYSTFACPTQDCGHNIVFVHPRPLT